MHAPAVSSYASLQWGELGSTNYVTFHSIHVAACMIDTRMQALQIKMTLFKTTFSRFEVEPHG